MKQGDIKWYHTSEYIDTETGEILSKSAFERGHYAKIHTETRHEFKITHGLTIHRVYVKTNPQTKLQL